MHRREFHPLGEYVKASRLLHLLLGDSCGRQVSTLRQWRGRELGRLQRLGRRAWRQRGSELWRWIELWRR
jgi:hypothetical protein